MIKKYKIKKFRRINKGFTLVETLVAISIFTVSLLGIMSVLASGISNTSYAKQKMVASYLAQEGIEYVRNMRDTAVLYPPSGQTTQDMWDVFRDNSLDLNSLHPYSDTSFSRTIIKTKINDNEVNISSDVKWNQGSGEHHIIFSENLFNWVE